MRTVMVPALRPGELTLSPAEAHHLARVLRAGVGDVVRLVDGGGHEAEAVVLTTHPDAVTVRVAAVRAFAPPPGRRVLLGQPRPALIEEALTLGTELGMTELWVCRAAWSHPGEVRTDRLERVLDSALKQCGRTDRPALRAFGGLATALDALPGGVRFLAAPGAPRARSYPPVTEATLAVGPEGGWSPQEQAELVGAGFAPLGLAAAILRAPTAVAAGLAALAISDS